MWSHLQITGTEEECGHTYKQQEYKECGHTYKQQEYKECGHTYKQQEYKECGHIYKQQLNRNRRSEWSHLHTITGIVEESDHTHKQPGVQGCDAGPVQNDDIASVDFTEHVMLSLADLISERKKPVLWQKPQQHLLIFSVLFRGWY